MFKRICSVLRKPVILSLLVIAGLPPYAGCASSTHEISEGSTSGHVILLPGVEGGIWQMRGMRQGLRDAGIHWTIEIIPWGTPPLHSLSNLTDLPANLKRAGQIAKRITELRAQRPNSAIVLVGYSGGGGLAMLTLNALQGDAQVNRVVLLAAAISNTYDLSVAQKRCSERIVNVYSPRDGIVGWGTSLFGTIDRRNTVSAGHSGFLKADDSLRVEDKLEQIAWSPQWEAYGHTGTHVCYLFRPWACHVLAPLIDPRIAAKKSSKAFSLSNDVE